jgi:hypothetical protein
MISLDESVNVNAANVVTGVEETGNIENDSGADTRN